MTEKRLVVFAYSEVGYRCLKLLIERGELIVAVFTHKDNPNEKVWFHSVSQLAREHNIPVYTHELTEPGTVEKISALKPDLILSFYYRKMIASDILNLAPLGAYNMHGSLLPKYRGRAPINWAILHGETETGATLHKMLEKPDAGEIIAQQSVSIEYQDTAQDVFLKVTEAACQVLASSIDDLKNQTAKPQTQDLSLGSYFGGRKPADGLIDWQQSAKQIYDLIRAVTKPYPGAFSYFREQQLIIWWASVRPANAQINAQPGEIINSSPLQIQTANGILQIEDYQWSENPGDLAKVSAEMKIGDTLSA